MKYLFKKIPAATMIIPMFLTAIINTLFPGIIGMGGITAAIFSKSAVLPLTGLLLFFCGTQLRLKEAPEALKRGTVLLLGKFAAGYIVGTAVYKMFGPLGIFGIPVLAIFPAILSSNSAIYLALTGEYGDQPDLGAFSILSIKDGPFLTLLAMGASGTATIPVKLLFASIFPMLIGVVIGNLYEGVPKYFKAGHSTIIPVLAIAIGASLDFKQVIKAGASGILLGIIVFVVGTIILISIDKLILRRPGYAGAALVTTAGSSVATPMIVAGVVPSLQKTAPIAATQLAAAVIITAILCSMLTSWCVRKWGAPKYNKEITAEQAS